MSHVSGLTYQLAEFQRALGDVVIILLELKSRRGLTRSDKREIDSAVADINEMIRSLPGLVAPGLIERLVFKTLTRLYRIGQKVLRKS